jgi:prepilin-type N-terminal cleavage/methylation domain-containing protein
MLRSRASGFTLIEVLVSISVFSLMTLGIVPLLASSIKGAAVSRTYTAGKNVTVEAMERARGLPFFVDYPTQKAFSSGMATPRRVDLLDLYLPAAASGSSAGGGGTYSAGTYTTICTSETGSNLACPRELPARYTVEYKAAFVEPLAVGSTEQYVVKAPPATYKWNPEPYASQDLPFRRLVRLTITTRWTYGGEQKSVTLGGLIGDREFGKLAATGRSSAAYVVQASTQYTNETTGQKTKVTGTAGTADSLIETKAQSTADQSVTASRITMSDLPLDVSGDVVELPPVEGATSSIHAAPDSTPAGASVGARSAVHDVFGEVGGVDGTTTSGLKVSVSQELPIAQGSFGFSAPAGTERLLYMRGQLGPDNSTALRLDASDGLLKFARRGTATISGSTSAETTPVNSASRRVQTAASTAFQRLRFLATSFINGTITDAIGSTTHRSVVVIDNFQASVSCKATGSTSTAAGTKSWSATLYFWADDAPNDNVVAGSYRRLDLSSALASDPLATYAPSATNPVVFDAPLGEEDIYLFQDEGRKGYLRTWSSSVGETTQVSADGRVVRAELPEALRIVSARTDPRYQGSSLTVQIGKLSCEAQDQR